MDSGEIIKNSLFFQVFGKNLDGWSQAVVKSSPLEKCRFHRQDWWGLVQWQDN